MQRKIEKEFGVSFSLESVRRLLIRHGLRHIIPRSHRSKAEFAAQKRFRDAFSKSVLNNLPAGLAPERVWIFFQASRTVYNARC